MITPGITELIFRKESSISNTDLSGTYGSSTSIPVLGVAANGRVSSITSTLAAGSGGAADLTNYFPIAGHTNIPKTDVNGRFIVVPDGIKTIKLVPSNLNDGGCVLGTDYNFIRLNINTLLKLIERITSNSAPSISNFNKSTDST